MSLSFLTIGYEHVNKGGLQRLFGIGNSARYNLINESFLGQLSFDSLLSSIQVTPSRSATANTILFSNRIGSIVPGGNFAGDFRQVVAAKNGAANFINLTDFGFNDSTRSILLVNTNRGPEIRKSFRMEFLKTWNKTLDEQLANSQASRKGDPLITWAAFPEGISFLSSDQIYLQISQPLNINFDWWPDYTACITYYLYLYLNGSRKLQGHCQGQSVWVESGIKSDEIKNQLWDKVRTGVQTIDQELEKKFASLPSFTDFYYLPGRQISPVEGVKKGNTWDDVTLVFEI